MSEDSVPTALGKARIEIDAIDQQLVALIAKRFAVTHQVGLIKAEQKLDAVDPQREANKFAEIKGYCLEHQLNPELAEQIFTLIMAEAVRNHRRIRGEG